jgi:hypothetical protein
VKIKSESTKLKDSQAVGVKYKKDAKAKTGQKLKPHQREKGQGDRNEPEVDLPKE